MKLLINILLLVSFGFIKGASLDSYLKNELKMYKSFTYKVLSLPVGVKSFADKKIMIDNSRNFKMNKGFAYIPVKIKASKSKTKSAFITVKVKLFADVWVANSKIKKNEHLSASRFNLVEKEISKLNNNIIRKKINFSNYKAAEKILEGSILNRNMLGEIPVVYRGDKMNAYSVFGSVIVNFSVTAKQNGSKGDVIRVIRNDRKLFKAEVIDNKNVKIVE